MSARTRHVTAPRYGKHRCPGGPVAVAQIHRQRTRRAAAAIYLPVVLALSGCTGKASIYQIPLSGGKSLKTTGALVIHVAPDECYYWVNDNQEPCIAIRGTSGGLLDKRFEREFTMSLVLDSLPAGSARSYRVRRRALRAKTRAGFTHTRSASLGGLVVIWDYGKDTLHGRFRITAKQQSYMVLTGWRGNRRVLFVGEFAAVQNRSAGERILARTEADGMARSPDNARPVRVNDHCCKHLSSFANAPLLAR